MQLVTVEVSADISPFVSVGPKGRLPVTVGGTTVGVLDLKPNSVFTADGLRAEVTAALGFELCCSAVREGVIGRPVRDGSTIRERLADVAARVSCEKPSGARGPQRAGLVLARRSPTAFGTSACRRALLPAAASDALLDMAAACREPVLGVGPVRDPSPVVYAPEVIAGSREGDGDAVPEIYDPDEGQVAPVRTLPILMYHRVAESVAEPLAPYAVTPAAFAEQLSWLRDQAFVSIDLDDWLPVAQSRTPLHRPGLVITFDDGYQDFADTAWPLLCEYGFGATVFLVTDLVGKTNRWDERLGGPVPLLDWRGIRALEEEGVRFGAHSTTHPPLTGIANNAVVGQAARSRATLTRMLRRPVAGFAYPYGDFDPAVAHLVGACGYVFGLTVECRRASFHDSLLTLPRIGILGDDGIADFARKLTET
jgi:peptidoglycan/xylan/chitin deacetylase (PgdA/CDA1 family)